jgi:formylglycine-generating enzyme required for sulfatase activity
MRRILIALLLIAVSSIAFSYDDLILVEKGAFMMGDIWGVGASDEKPTHKVIFDYDFYIGKYEVTLSEYSLFLEAKGQTRASETVAPEMKELPVTNVTWWDAIAYCNWLSEKEGLAVAYRLLGEPEEGQLLDSEGKITTDVANVVGYRLPTEAEWEFAARGGILSRGFIYSGSDDPDQVAWHPSNSGGEAQDVGKKVPNELGIFDMSGNVWEWCSDWHALYSDSERINPYVSSGTLKPIRGASFGDEVTCSRVSYRGYVYPDNANDFFGFRVCRREP